VRRALGEYAGFIVGWSDWLVLCSALALAAMLIGEYAAALFSFDARLITPLATSLVVGFALVQWRGTRAGSRVQNITAIAKTVTFAVLICACFAVGSGFSRRGPEDSQFGPEHPWFTAIILAVQAVIFTYDGYYGIIYFSGELRNPARDIPRVMFGGVFAVAAIYILVNIAFLFVLPTARMAGDSLVAASVAGEVFGSKGDTVIRTLTILSLLSAANASALMASRVVYRLGVAGYVRSGGNVNDGGTPTVGLLLSAIAALTLVMTGTFEVVLALTAFFFVATYTLTFASLLVLRRTEPSAPRPYRAVGHPWTTWGVLIISAAFLLGAIAADTRNSVYSLILLMLSLPLYYVLRPKTPSRA
jgi:APA family basic amino acid/polyamine antiporter